jgi:phage-related minor tail protein
MKFPSIDAQTDWPQKWAKLKRSLASVGRHLKANRVKEERKANERREREAVELALANSNSSANTNS